jgi:hypothetical protein
MGDTNCANFYECGYACETGSASSDAGGGGYCLATSADAGTDDAGADDSGASATQNCASCCVTETPSGQSAYLGDLVKACVCASGATCAAACAM